MSEKLQSATTQYLLNKILAPHETGLCIGEWSVSGAEQGGVDFLAPYHSHPEDEVFYVLEGQLGFRLAGSVSEVGAGGAVVVGGGIPHTFWNADPRPARFNIVMGPRTFALYEAIHAADDRSDERVGRLFDEFDGELITSLAALRAMTDEQVLDFLQGGG